MQQLFIEAYATTDILDAPTFVRVTVDDDFTQRLQRLRTLCVQHELSEVRVEAAPDAWGGDPAIADDLRLRGDELVVTKDAFWFTAYPKHGSFMVESRAQEIDMIHGIRSSGVPVAFLGDNVSDDLFDQVLDHDPVAPGIVDTHIVACEESALPLLKSLADQIGPYQPEQGGAAVTASLEKFAEIMEYGDFGIVWPEPKPKAVPVKIETGYAGHYVIDLNDAAQLSSEQQGWLREIFGALAEVRDHNGKAPDVRLPADAETANLVRSLVWALARRQDLEQGREHGVREQTPSIVKDMDRKLSTLQSDVQAILKQGWAFLAKHDGKPLGHAVTSYAEPDSDPAP